MLILPVLMTTSFTLGIAGVRGGLGRELASQAIEKNWRVVGFVREDKTLPVYEPFRRGWLTDETKNLPEISSPKLSLALPDDRRQYDALVLAMSGKPFQPDTSVSTTQQLFRNLPPSCRSVVLVSAHGVSDSLKDANVGIKIMERWYLNDVYEAKKIQESLVQALPSHIGVHILRPKVLSYGSIPFNDIYTTRQDLAQQICTLVDV